MAWTSPTWTATKSGPHTLRRTPPRASRRSRPALDRYSALPIPWSRGRPSSCTIPPNASTTSASSPVPVHPFQNPKASPIRVPPPGTKPHRTMCSPSLPRTRLAAFRPSSPSQPRSWPIWSRQPLISVRRRASGSPAIPTSQPKLPAMTHPVTTRRSPPHTTTASNSSRTA